MNRCEKCGTTSPCEPKECADLSARWATPMRDRLPLRDDVQTVTYHRPPTEAEIRRGYGATHYADFPVADCCIAGTRIAKRWFVSPHDGLRYY